MRAVLLSLLLLVLAAPVAAQGERTGCYMNTITEPANGAAGVRVILLQYFPTRAMLYEPGATMAKAPDQTDLRALGTEPPPLTRQWLLEPGTYLIDFAGMSGGFTHELALQPDTLVTIYVECM